MRRYKGISYPIEKTIKGLLYCGDDIAQIKADMLAIILTRPGERIFEPRFGTPLYKLKTSMPQELIITEARQMIASSIKTWEKRIQLTDIQCVLVPDREGKLDINIQILFIDPVNLQTLHQLTLQLPLGE